MAGSLAMACCPLLVLLQATLASAFCPDGAATCCHVSNKDPQYSEFKGSAEHEVPGWSIVNLDAPPAERWANLVAPKAKEIQDMINTFKGFLSFISADLLKIFESLSRVQSKVPEVLAALPMGYGEEIAGIANATGIPVLDLMIYNMFYEIEKGCTSIVAQDVHGRLVHGRNLDFGLFLGEDWKHAQWALTEKLRPLLRRVAFVKEGHVVFNTTVYLGYIGMLTGAKKGGFSISVNSRGEHGQRPHGLRDFISGRDRSSAFLSLLLREVMLHNQTYDEALATIRSAKLIGPAYIIMGGSKPGEGVVLARNQTGVVQERSLAASSLAGKPYLVQTNWDYPHDPLIDNRRVPAEHCLAEASNMTFEAMFKVLAAHPNRNRLTTYTALMSAQTGALEAYLQFCTEIDCAPWMAEQSTQLVV